MIAVRHEWRHEPKVPLCMCPPGQRSCPFGDAALLLNDAVLAAESCEELFTPAAPHIAYALAGVEIITNGSGSHHQVHLFCVE